MMARQCSQTPQGSVVGPPVPSGPMQFMPLAMIRAVVVFPVPRMPVMMNACAIRSAAKAFLSVRTIASCPTRSAKVSGRYFRASTWYAGAAAGSVEGAAEGSSGIGNSMTAAI